MSTYDWISCVEPYKDRVAVLRPSTRVQPSVNVPVTPNGKSAPSGGRFAFETARRSLLFPASERESPKMKKHEDHWGSGRGVVEQAFVFDSKPL